LRGGIDAVVEGRRVLRATGGVCVRTASTRLRRKPEPYLCPGGQKPLLSSRVDGKLEALMGAAATVKPTCREGVALLPAMGVETVMVNGDKPRHRGAIARETGIGRGLARCSAGQGVAGGSAGRERSRIAMVGDGYQRRSSLRRRMW
jgi:cation transport ATPase